MSISLVFSGSRRFSLDLVALGSSLARAPGRRAFLFHRVGPCSLETEAGSGCLDGNPQAAAGGASGNCGSSDRLP